MNKFRTLLACGFGLGHAPFASGTFGTLLGLPLAWAINTYLGVPGQVIAGLLLTLFAIWVWRRADKIERKDEGGRWTLAEVSVLLVVVAVFSFVFHLPYQFAGGDGKMTAGEPDMGYLAQNVLALPEAGVANLWSAALGSEAAGVTAGRDFYYHWGPILLAVAARGVTDMPPMTALADVSCHVMNVLVVIAAAALASGLIRGPLWAHLLVGGAAVAGSCLLKTPEFITWVSSLLPWKDVQQAKFTLASLFPYKFEAIIALTAAAVWIRKEHRLAALFLFLGAVSAPHAVASIGVTSAGLAGLGICTRDRRMAGTGFAMMGLILAGWALAVIGFRATMGGGGGGLFKVDFAEVGSLLKLGLLDSLIAFALSAMLLPGIIHLIRGHDEEATDETKMLGWLAPCGVVGSAFAFHFMHAVGDSFHVMVFAHAVILAPIAILGIARLISRQEKGRLVRVAGAAVLAASSAMGLHALVASHATHPVAEWKAADLDRARKVLKGEVFGYYAREDRGWWISKNAVLASLLGSRCVRLNALKSERESGTSKFYDYTKPFSLVPPAEKESGLAWSLRFAQKLGVRYLVETIDDNLPKPLLKQTRLRVCVSGIRIYELVDGPGAVAAN